MAPYEFAAMTALITGANSGIGLAITGMLAERGVHVVMACRNLEASRRILKSLQGQFPAAKITLVHLDLADLASVEQCALTCTAQLPRIDLLVNNAAVMAPPFTRSAQGFELQIAVNHLGHFALTGRLLPLLKAAPHPRLVVVGSNAALDGSHDFADLAGTDSSYDPVAAYRRSKLANHLFALEAATRFAGSPLTVALADPGYTRTQLQRHVPGLLRRMHARYTRWRYAHSVDVGAERILRAITDTTAPNGAYFRAVDDAPVPIWKTFPDPRSSDLQARALWQDSEKITSTHFDFSWP